MRKLIFLKIGKTVAVLRGLKQIVNILNLILFTMQEQSRVYTSVLSF